jgi:hypothetical protein
MRKLFTGLLLSMLLLLTQQGGMLHQLGHVPAGQAQTDREHEHPAGAALCAACLAFSHIGSGASGVAAPVPLASDLAFAAPTHAAPLGDTLAVLLPRSRGPPTRL